MPLVQTIQRASTRYRVRWMESGVRRSRNFAVLAEAEAFAATLPNRSLGLPLSDRIGRRVVIDPSGCWIWQGTVNNEGYAAMTVQAPASRPRTMLVHRLSYVEFEGPIPEGMVIDHLCRVRHCVNPLHLEPVTQRENVLRSPIALGALNAAKTHCKRGHEYTPENTKVYVLGPPRACTMRVCVICQRESQRRAYARRKAVSA